MILSPRRGFTGSIGTDLDLDVPEPGSSTLTLREKVEKTAMVNVSYAAR